jgi:membrane-bound lytic murein transglycosylase
LEAHQHTDNWEDGMARRTVDEMLEAEADKIEKAKARIARLKAKKRESTRKQDTRRKILAGSLLLERIESDERIKAWFERELDGFLTRDSDRKLFGLEPLTKNEDDPLGSTVELPPQQ